MPWFVSFEARKCGAIGIFEEIGRSSIEDDRKDAIEAVRIALEKQGFELRFPKKIYRYEENVEY